MLCQKLRKGSEAMSELSKYLAEQRKQYLSVISESSRGQSAYQLANIALEHSGSSSAAAASLLLSLEYGKGFNLQDLVLFDSENRAHADLVITGCIAHELWPSAWMSEAGYDGKSLINEVRNKWE